jgi:hypothetical protein
VSDFPFGECKTAPVISFSIIRLGISGLNLLKAMIPTCPEQWDGIPTWGCSSKIETETFFLAIARAAVAPLTPHPTMAASTELVGKFSRLPTNRGRKATCFLSYGSFFGEFDAALAFHLS